MRGERPYRRKPAGGKGYGAAQRRNGLRRPKEHGVLRQLCHLWAGPLSGDGHRHGHGNGQDRPASEKHGGTENAAAGQSGPVRQKAVHHHSGDLRSAVWRQRAVAARKRDERLPLRRRFGSGGHPRSPQFHRDHRAVLRHPENGQGKRHHPPFAGGGGAWQRVSHLLG